MVFKIHRPSRARLSGYGKFSFGKIFSINSNEHQMCRQRLILLPVVGRGSALSEINNKC